MPNDYDDIIDNATELDPFASDPGDDDQALGEDDPFAGSSSGSSAVSAEDYDEYEVPPTPIGVLPGFVKTAKIVVVEKNGSKKQSLVLGIECSDPKYTGAAPVDLWLELPRFIERAQKIALALGLPAPRGNGRIRLPKPSQFVNRPGLFTFSTYLDKQDTPTPQIAWGLPKQGKSEGFDEWLAAARYTDKQLKTIAGSPGVLPLNALK